MKPLALAIVLLTPIAFAATNTSRDGYTEERAIIMRGSLVSFENTAYRLISQRYPDAICFRLSERLLLMAAHTSPKSFSTRFPMVATRCISTLRMLIDPHRSNYTL